MRSDADSKEKLLVSLIKYSSQARQALQIVSDLREDLDNFHFHEIEGGEMDQLFRTAITQAWDARSTLRELHNKIREIAETAEEVV